MDLRGKNDWTNQNLIVRIPVDPVVGKDGNEIKGKFLEVQGKEYDVYGVNANLVLVHRGDKERQQVLINTKEPITKTTNEKFDENILKRQYDVTKAVADLAKSNAPEASAKAPEVDAEVQTPDVEPDFGN